MVHTQAKTLAMAAHLEMVPLEDKVFQYAKKWKYAKDSEEVARLYPGFGDPRKTELLRSAKSIISEGPKQMRLDCDDYSILIGSLMMSLGYPVRLVVIAADPARPKKFSHVYPEVSIRGRATAMDALLDRPGLFHPQWFRRKFYSV